LRAKSMLGNAKSNRHRKTQEVEPDDTGRNIGHLTRGDLSGESLAQKSAEAVVVKKAGESRKERRAKEPRDRPTGRTLEKRSEKFPETV
jgi:hypothetical protein